MGPELRCGNPVWWHSYGSRIKVNHLSSGWLSLRGIAASLSIQKAINRFPSLEYLKGQWFIDWTLTKCGQTEEMVQGRIRLTLEELQIAFCLVDDPDPSGNRLIERYGGDTAVPGKFIRWESHLNIPGPGTGQDGDPNISIDVSQEIQTAVIKLIAG